MNDEVKVSRPAVPPPAPGTQDPEMATVKVLLQYPSEAHGYLATAEAAIEGLEADDPDGEAYRKHLGDFLAHMIFKTLEGQQALVEERGGV